VKPEPTLIWKPGYVYGIDGRLLSQGGCHGRPKSHSASCPTFVTGLLGESVIGAFSGAPHTVEPASFRFHVWAFHADQVPVTVIA